MIRLITLFILIFMQFTWAEELSPGSYRIEYGGLYKLAADESFRVLENRWRDQEFHLWEQGQIEFGELTRRNIWMSNHLNDWRHGPPWWTRSWWQSFEIHKGGAPPNNSIVVRKGSNFKLIDTPLFSISNSFAFRWKAFQASIDFKAEKALAIGIGDIPDPGLGWKFKVSPEFKFSTMRVFDKPQKSVRRIGLVFTMTHWVRRKPLLAIEVVTWYSSIKNEGFLGIQFTLLQW